MILARLPAQGADPGRGGGDRPGAAVHPLLRRAPPRDAAARENGITPAAVPNGPLDNLTGIATRPVRCLISITSGRCRRRSSAHYVPLVLW